MVGQKTTIILASREEKKGAGLRRAGAERRVLVDRLWPRGRSKEDLALDDWRKEVAPSDDLRRWFGHETERWEDVVATGKNWRTRTTRCSRCSTGCRAAGG